MLTSPLSFFQPNNPNNNDIWRGSAWFITSDKDSPTTSLIRELWRKYWRDYNYALHYFIIDMFIKMAKLKFPKEWENMPYYSTDIVHALQFYGMYEPYSPELMKQFTDASDFHKLTYKLSRTPAQNSIYRYIIDNA